MTDELCWYFCWYEENIKLENLAFMRVSVVEGNDSVVSKKRLIRRFFFF